eukprot:TRINITY_DN4097_c0_g3_i8.p1 TRINITY_DN4097_c0_g3~~TRINITY_DN4097_c0_g3_i8.p1  ORF type:complete len:134 (+),score=19.84 TRINITY_DN4097_c0_g3_i8:101-502(+)
MGIVFSKISIIVSMEADNYYARTLFVGNLDETFTPETLRNLFQTFGEIKNIELPFDQASKKSRGYGFVEFDEVEDAEHAQFNLDEAEVYGRVIKVRYAKPTKKKPISSKPVWEDPNWHNEQGTTQNVDNENDS